MFNLILIIRIVCWALWFLLYIVVAAWVGQGHFADVQTRSVAAFLGFLWGLVGAMVFEFDNVPARIAKAMMRDD